MDDVIERMAASMIASNSFLAEIYPYGWVEVPESSKKAWRNEIRSALRAVHDTHRLVPVGPTKEMQESMLHQVARFDCFGAYQKAIEAAPDYTGSDDG